MPIQYIVRRSTALPAIAKPGAAPFYVDLDDNKLKMIPAGSGTTEVVISDSTIGVQDSNGLNRLYANPTAKTIVDGSATSLFSVLCATGASIGGAGFFTVFVADGTDFQADSGLFTYSAVNKAGTSTATITYATANEAKAVSAGTLTLAFTAVDSGAGVITYKLQPTGSLTETTYNITYTLFPLKGVVTII